MERVDGCPAVLIGLAAGDVAGGEATALALCSLSAFPSDAGLEARALEALFDWLDARPPSVCDLTRRALETSAVEAWRAAGEPSSGATGLAHAAAAVAAGRQGAPLVTEVISLTALTHADPETLMAAATTALALRGLLDGARYDEAWRGAWSQVQSLEPRALLRPLGDDYVKAVAAATPGAGRAVGDAVHAGLVGRRVSNRPIRTSLEAVVAGARPDASIGEHAPDVAALIGAVVAARDGQVTATEITSGETHWSAWPADDGDPVTRLEQACRRAAGVVAPSGYPDHVPVFVVHRLHPQILYGRNPLFAEEAAALAAAGVSHVLDLRDSWEWEGPGRLGAEAVAWIEAHDMDRLHLPAPDGGAPERSVLEEAVAFIDAAVAGGGTVFVHCRAGQERSGAILLAWLLPRGGDLDALRDLAPVLRPLPNQQAAVYDWLRARSAS